MYYQTFSPWPALEPFVDCFWVLAAPASAASPGPEIVLPDGRTELLVHFGDAFQLAERDPATHTETFVQQARVLMSGQLTQPILLKPSGRIGVVSARFHPAGAARFFDLPYEKLVDRVVDFSTFEALLSATLHNQVAAAQSHQDRVAVMQEWLTRLLKRESEADAFVRHACRHLMQSHGAYTVQQLARLIGFSERQLARKFKKQVGLTPKILARIMRFQRFLALARTTRALTLADAAQCCGYYDQSHFIRDFTAFSGVSPLNYLTASHEMSDHFTTPT